MLLSYLVSGEKEADMESGQLAIRLANILQSDNGFGAKMACSWIRVSFWNQAGRYREGSNYTL